MEEKDPRRTVGARVHAKAMHVASLAECARRYGILKKSKLVNGTVVEVRVDKSGKRANVFVTAEYHLSGTIFKKKELNLRSVYRGESLDASQEIVEDGFCSETPTNTSNGEDDVRGRTDKTQAYSDADKGTVDVHGQIWQTGDVELPVGGALRSRVWAVHLPSGIVLHAGQESCEYSALDLFLVSFSPSQLKEMRRLTNIQMRKQRYNEVTCGELLKFFGVLVLMTRLEFGSRASLWSTTSEFKFQPAHSLGKTGISRAIRPYIQELEMEQSAR
jgi:Transposase IS4